MMKKLIVLCLSALALCGATVPEKRAPDPLMTVRQGKDAKEDLQKILDKTETVQLFWISTSPGRKNKIQTISPDWAETINEILSRDCYAIDWRDADIDGFGDVPVLEFLDAKGAVVGQVMFSRICSASAVRDGRHGLSDLVLPDDRYRQLLQLLK